MQKSLFLLYKRETKFGLFRQLYRSGPTPTCWRKSIRTRISGYQGGVHPLLVSAKSKDIDGRRLRLYFICNCSSKWFNQFNSLQRVSHIVPMHLQKIWCNWFLGWWEVPDLLVSILLGHFVWSQIARARTRPSWCHTSWLHPDRPVVQPVSRRWATNPAQHVRLDSRVHYNVSKVDCRRAASIGNCLSSVTFLQLKIAQIIKSRNTAATSIHGKAAN